MAVSTMPITGSKSMLKSAGIASLKISLSHGVVKRAQLGSDEAPDGEGEAASKLAAAAAGQEVNGRSIVGRKSGAGRPRGAARRDMGPRALEMGLWVAVQGGTRSRSASLGDCKIDMLMSVSVDTTSLNLDYWRCGNYFICSKQCPWVLASGLSEPLQFKL